MLHPNMAIVYRQRVARSMTRSSMKPHGAGGGIIRSLVSEMMLIPENGFLQLNCAATWPGF